MKNNILLTAIMLLMALAMPAASQAQKATVKGVLVDSLSLEGEPYATIRVFRAGKADKAVAMSVTDMDGRFEQEVPGKGDFEMLLSSVGKTDVTVQFSLKGGETIDLGTLYTKDDVQTLSGIEVVAQRPLVKMEVDKMTYSTEDDVDSKSSSVLEMLRKVPMVTVDGNDNITVNGSSSFQVFVDGKPNTMITSNPSTILKNMPASSVKSIEVITNPGVKYDAEGVGGVLNLITNKSGEGQSGLGDGYNGTLRGNYGTRGGMAGAYFSMQKGKFSMTANGNIMKTKMKDTEAIVEREQYESSGTSFLSSSSKGDIDTTIKMINLSASYEIDSLRTVSASFGLMGLDYGTDFGNSTSMWGGSYGDGFGYTGQSVTDYDNYSINASLDYQRAFAGVKDRMLTLSYRFSSTPKKSKTYSLFDAGTAGSYLDLTDRFSDTDDCTSEHTFQADYTTPLAQGHLLSVGAKFIARNNHSDSDYYLDEDGSYVYSESNSLNYKHDNSILAGYAEYDGKWGKMGLKGGLRYEHTWQNVKYAAGQGENFSLDYGNLVPSVNLSYMISQSQNIGVTYNMRISRPGITYLNPYVDRTDPTSLTYGNTDLECEEAHNISLVYNLFTPKWIVNLTLRQAICDNAIESYSFYEDNVLHTTYGNIVKNRETGLNAYINWNAGSKTRIYMNGGVSYADLRSGTLGMKNNGWKGNIMLGAQQTLPWKLRLSLNFIGSTKSQTLQGWSNGMDLLMATLTRPFLKDDRLNVSVMGVTPLSGSCLELKTKTAGTDFVSLSTTRVPLRTLSFSVSWTFGRQHQSKTVKKTIQNTDVKDRQSQTEGLGNMIMQ